MISKTKPRFPGTVIALLTFISLETFFLFLLFCISIFSILDNPLWTLFSLAILTPNAASVLGLALKQRWSQYLILTLIPIYWIASVIVCFWIVVLSIDLAPDLTSKVGFSLYGLALLIPITAKTVLISVKSSRIWFKSL